MAIQGRTMQFHLTHLIHIKRHPQFVEARNYSLRSSRCINFACLMGLQYLQLWRLHQILILHQIEDLKEKRH